VDYHLLARPIARDEVIHDLLKLDIPDGPAQQSKNGRVQIRLAYFMPFSREGLETIYQAAPGQDWPEWAIKLLNRRKQSPNASGTPPDEIERAVAEAEQQGAFNPTDLEDARLKVLVSVVRRRGQRAFRDALLDAYDGRCAITECGLSDVLEAAHIHPYMGDQTNDVRNGLLLRADVHTLFDLGLVAIDPDTLAVLIAPRLRGTVYQELSAKKLRVP
jgi:hypothetical protein